jgi:TetR/AcrR family transcriptional regulator, transcriptional repressor of bet genes
MSTKAGHRRTAVTRADRGEQTRARLLDSTLRAIAEDGVAGASVERITARAGVSRGLVRHYYGSKSQLLAEAFQLLADDYRAMLGMGARRSTADTPRHRLREAIVQAFEQIRGVHDRQYAWFGFWALARSDPGIEEINNRLYEEVVSHLGDLFSKAAAEERSTLDPARAGRGLAAMIEGAWVHSTIGVEGMTLREAERICLDYAARLLSVESLD